METYEKMSEVNNNIDDEDPENVELKNEKKPESDEGENEEQIIDQIVVEEQLPDQIVVDEPDQIIEEMENENYVQNIYYEDIEEEKKCIVE